MTTEEPKVCEFARYNISQVAKLLGVSRSTVYRFIERGRMRTSIRKVDNRVVVTGLEIQKAWRATL